MNVVADRLFSLLLGWTRGLFNNIWNLVTNHSTGISSFLERFWLPLIVILLLAGTVADYVVWIVRWRPHYVWRNWFMRRNQEKRMEATHAYMEDLDQVPLDLEYGMMEDTPFTPMLPQEEAVDYLAEDAAGYTYQEPYLPEENWQQPQLSYPPAPAGEYTGGSAEPALPFAAWTAEPEAAPQAPWQEEHLPYMPQELAEYPAPEESPMAYAPFEAQTPFYEAPAEAPAVEDKPATRRRRRAQSKHQRPAGLLHTLRETLLDTDPTEQLDSLPPPISQEEAFHQPYYPANYRYRSAPGEGEDQGQG